MSQPFNEQSRAVLARSLPLVHQHEPEIVARMETGLAAVAGSEAAFGHPELTARALTGLLVAQAEAIAEHGRTGDLDVAIREHRLLGIVGRHYSRFGDLLVPILKDVLGVGTPNEVPAVWCDTFWAVISAMQPRDELVDA